MKGRAVIQATIDDAVPHIYSREQADAIIAGYPEHERDARAKGVPTLGSGRIYPVDEESIAYEPSDFEIPRHFVWIGGIDLGWDHPTAAVKCAWDRDCDAFYVTEAYKRSEATPLIHSGALRHWGEWLPWSWPADGLQHDKSSGVQLAQTYRDNGMKMLPEFATHPDGSRGVEAGIMQLLEAMQTGRLKVASHLVDWFHEFRLYHRKAGRIAKEFDDLMDATRYAWMMRRKAVQHGGRKQGKINYSLGQYV